MDDFLSILLPLLSVALVLILCYFFSRYLGKKMGSVVNTSNIKVIERVTLGQDKSLIIAEICKTYYLLAVTNQSIKILKELDSEGLIKKEDTPASTNFIEILNKAIKGRKAGGDK